MASGGSAHNKTDSGGPSARHAAFSRGGALAAGDSRFLWRALLQKKINKIYRAPQRSKAATVAAAAALNASNSVRMAPQYHERPPLALPGESLQPNMPVGEAAFKICLNSPRGPKRPPTIRHIRSRRLEKQHAAQAADSTTSSKETTRAPTAQAAHTSRIVTVKH